MLLTVVRIHPSPQPAIMINNTIHENITKVQNRVKAACERSNRNPDDIQIILVTKTVKPDLICKAVACGYNILGENRIQEIEQKFEPVSECNSGIKWYF